MSRSLSYDPAAPGATDVPYHRALNFCAIAVMLSVFPLIWMGGLVTSHGAGLSVPDWPNSYGYNMFLFPPSEWVGGILFEHSHRLLGTLSGFLSIMLVLLAFGPARNPGTRHRIGVFTVAMLIVLGACFALRVLLSYSTQLTDEFLRALSHLYVLFGSLALIGAIAWFCRTREQRRWVRWLAVAQLLLIILQGVKGGLRVTEVSLTLAMIHACFAQVFFCLTAFTALATSRWWLRARDRSGADDAPAARRAMKIALLACLLIFAQLVAGAIMRHNNAGLAIHDLPLAFGRVIPPATEAQLEPINADRVWFEHLPGVTVAQVWMHFAHRIGAVLVTLAILALALVVFRRLRRRRDAVLLTAMLCALLAVQFTLGLLTVYLRKPADIASLHVAVGAVTFVATTQLAIMLARQFARSRERVRADSTASIGQLAPTWQAT